MLKFWKGRNLKRNKQSKGNIIKKCLRRDMQKKVIAERNIVNSIISDWNAKVGVNIFNIKNYENKDIYKF